MDSVIEQLSEIEKAAEAIVDHAQQQKSEIEKRIQEKRDRFDHELSEQTQKELEAIREEAGAHMDKAMEEQRQKNRDMVEGLQREYEEHHEAYAGEILKRILNV